MATGNAYNTGSTLTFPGGNNKTSTSLSTNILIMVNGTPVGAIQQFTINETRTIKPIDEIGTDGHIDSCPTSSTNIEISCKRVRFDRLRISEAFGRGFVHASSQAYPFDIVVLDRQKGSTAGAEISTIIKNCWIKSISVSYSASEWIITEDMGLTAETIYSFVNQGNTDTDSGGPQNAVANGGERQIPISKINVERETDTGSNGRRGSMDAAGLIDIGSDPDIF